MKKLLLLTAIVLIAPSVYCGGLVTHTNQSAMFTRFQCRDSSLDIDAAFYNPAGLVHRSDGFYLSLNNQTMGQVKLITTDYSNIEAGDKEYRGQVSLPLFPTMYGAWKKGKWAFSAGINPIAGDGKARYDDGLPSVTMKLSDATRLTQTRLEPVDLAVEGATSVDPQYSNITGYDVDLSYSTRSLTMGYQGNVAFQVNEFISVAAGARIVHSSNYIRANINNFYVTGTNSDGDFRINPAEYLRTVAVNVDTIATAILNSTADEIDARTLLEADITQSGIGVTPVISINYAPSLMTNWSVKYEFRTNLDLETRIIDGKDAGGKYTDGTVVIADIPAMFSIGLTRRPSPRFMFYSGLHYYFDKPIDFDGSETLNIDMIEKNSYEFGFGGEYQVNSTFRLSTGILLNRPGVNAAYQSEKRYALASNTIGAGFGLRLSQLVDFNIGASYTLYKKGERTYIYNPEDGVTNSVPVTEFYDTRAWIISAGIDFLFGENN